MGDSKQQPEQPRLTIRIPEILRARMETYAAKMKVDYPKYSLNDFCLSAFRLLLDGPAVIERQVPNPAVVHTGQRRSPLDIPGVLRGAEVFGSINSDAVDVGNAPVEDVKTKPWLPLWTKLLPKMNDDPDTFYEEMKRLAPGFGPKQAFWKLSVEAQAEALDKKYPLEVE